MKNLVSKLNNLMIEKDINCLELSKRTGIPNTTLSTLLKGRTDKFDIVKLQKICDVLNCTLDYLMNDNIDPDDSGLYVKEDSNVYYFDKETARYAQEIANNPEMKMLFDASKNIKKEDMQLVYEMIKRFKKDAE